MASASNCYQSFLYVSKYLLIRKPQWQRKINSTAFTNCAVQSLCRLKKISITRNDFLDFTWHCSTAAAGLVTLDFIFNTAFYAVKWVFSPQLHFPHSSIFLTAEGNRTCKFDQILWPMLSSTKISCLTGVLNPGLLCVKPRLYHWAKLPLLKMRGKTVNYILHKYILGYFGNQQKATDQINSRLNKQQKTTDFKKQQISKTTDFKNSRFQKTDFKNNS